MIRVLLVPVFLILTFSWFAFSRAALDDALLYLPLKSFLLAIPVVDGSKFFASPSTLIAANHFSLGFIYKLVHELFNWFVVLIFSWSFWLTIKSPDKFQLGYKQVILIAAPFALSMIFLLPQDSSDLFGYIARGTQQVYYDANPYATVVADIPNFRQDPLLMNHLWQHNPSPYGPVFMFLTKLIVSLSFGNFWLALFLFKLANLIAWILLLWFIYKLVHQKQYGVFIFAAVALNPFVHIEALWNGHNDIYMALTILAAVYYASTKEFSKSLIFFSLSCLIKYFTLALLPLLLICFYKSFSRKLCGLPWMGIGGSLIMTTASVVYYRLWDIKLSSMSENIVLSHKSLFDVFNSLYKYLFAGDLPQIAKYVFLSAFVIFACLLYWRFCFSKSQTGIWDYSFVLLAALILVFSPKFHSWYLLNLVGLGVLVRPRLILVLTTSHLLSLTFIDQANILNYLLMTLIPVLFYFRYWYHQDTL